MAKKWNVRTHTRRTSGKKVVPVQQHERSRKVNYILYAVAKDDPDIPTSATLHQFKEMTEQEMMALKAAGRITEEDAGYAGDELFVYGTMTLDGKECDTFWSYNGDWEPCWFGRPGCEASDWVKENEKKGS